MQVFSDMAGKKTKKGHPKEKRVVVRTSRTHSGAVAVHANAGEHHVVGIGDLRVMIVREDDDCWFARGLEIDFAEQGTSLDDVQTRFEESLADTIKEHLMMRGNIRELLRLAPADVWKEFYDGVTSEQFQLTCVTAARLLPHLAPGHTDGKQLRFFDNIQYHMPAPAPAQA